MIYGVVVSSPPETDPSEITRVLADTVVVVREGDEGILKSSLASLAVGRRVSGGIFVAWTFDRPLSGALRAVLDPPRAGWSALLHDDPDQLRVYVQQARFQADETEKKSSRNREGL